MKKSINNLLTALMGVLVLSFMFMGCNQSPKLQRLADEMNKSFPKDFGDGIVGTKAEVTNDCFVMHMEGDEENSLLLLLALMDDSGAINTEISKQYKEIFLKDNTMKEIFQECIKEKKGFKMTVKGKQSGKTADIFYMTPEEMQEEM